MPSGDVFVPGYGSSSSDGWSECVLTSAFTRLRSWVRAPQRPLLVYPGQSSQLERRSMSGWRMRHEKDTRF